MLSSIWAQAISAENTPENYEAIAHTYSLVLLFSRAKVSAALLATVNYFLAVFLCNVLKIRGFRYIQIFPIPTGDYFFFLNYLFYFVYDDVITTIREKRGCGYEHVSLNAMTIMFPM